MIKTIEQWLTGKRLLIILTMAAAVWFSFTAVMTVLRYRLNYASAYDFGIFHRCITTWIKACLLLPHVSATGFYPILRSISHLSFMYCCPFTN